MQFRIANQSWVWLRNVLVCDWQPVAVRSLLFFESSLKTLVDLRQRERADGGAADATPTYTHSDISYTAGIEMKPSDYVKQKMRH